MQNEVGHKQVYGAAPKNTQNQNSACTFQSKSWTFSLLLGEYLLSLRSLPWNYQSASNQSNRKEGFCAATSLQSILPSNSQQPPVTTCQPVQEYNFFFSLATSGCQEVTNRSLGQIWHIQLLRDASISMLEGHILFSQGAVSSLTEMAPGTSFRPVLGDTSVSAER